MQNYGKKIAELRLAKNMTQAQLGKELNVTAQAVSKWEKGASEPDLNTIKSICELFEITPDEFFGSEPKNKNDETESEENADVSATEVASVYNSAENDGVLAADEKRTHMEICSRCGKKLYSNAEFEIREKKDFDTDDFSVKNPREIICSDCLAKEKIEKNRAELEKDRGSVTRGLVTGSITGALAAIIAAIAAAPYFETVQLVFLALGVGYGCFAFVSQCFYCEFLIDMLLFFCRTLKFPAIIFSFDLDGIAFLIGLKILFAIIGAVFSITVFLFGLVFCLAVAAVTFPFSFAVNKRSLTERESKLPPVEKSADSSDGGEETFNELPDGEFVSDENGECYDDDFDD